MNVNQSFVLKLFIAIAEKQKDPNRLESFVPFVWAHQGRNLEPPDYSPNVIIGQQRRILTTPSQQR